MSLGLTLGFPGNFFGGMTGENSLCDRLENQNNKENKQPECCIDPAGNLLWLLDFKLDKLLPGQIGSDAEIGKVSENATDDTSKTLRPIAVEETAKKPPYTYTEMIEQALTEHGPLTVSDIYRWISDKFPYFKPDDDKWKNSVRHNLSISPHFRKSTKSGKGAGHLWTLAIPGSKLTGAWQRRKTILTPPKPANQENIADKEKEKQNNIVDEAARACLELLRAEGIENMETEEPVKNDSFFGRERSQSPITLDQATELLLGPDKPSQQQINQPIEQRVEVEYLPHNDFDTLCNAYDLDMHAFNFEETYNYTDSQLQSSHEYYAGNPNGYQDILFNDALCLGMSLEIL
ncbi:forkhead box protein A2-like [Artemia franciscana]|uniref:forkhead box protein A2-like n=1 Tax=Artemia franciscana TaxID=6661 RepID=UPI0032DAB6BF